MLSQPLMELTPLKLAISKVLDVLPKVPKSKRGNGKLNILIETASLDKGGMEQVIFDLSTGLDKSSFNTHIVCIEKDGYMAEKCRKAGIRVHLINKNKAKYEKLVKRLNVDLINTHYSQFGLDIASRNSIPVVSVIHNTYIWLTPAEVEAFKNADKYITKYVAVSANVCRYSMHYFGIHPQKIEIIPNGIDISDDRVGMTHKPRGAFGLKDDDYVILNVGSYNPSKAHNLIIASMKEIVGIYPKIKVVCVGPVGDGAYYGMLKKKIKANGLENNILLTGFVPDGDLNSLYLIADAFLLPSLFEGWSVSALEAMFWGLPMILTDVGGAREIIQKSDIGIIIPNTYGNVTDLNFNNVFDIYKEERPSNTDALIMAISNFYEHRDAWKESGKKGKKKVTDGYNEKDAIMKYEKLFVNIVKKFTRRD